MAAAAVTPSLILPPRYRRRKLPDPNTIVRVAVPVGAVFAGARPTEAELVQTLTPLCRDDVIFECAMINALVSGLESAETRDRQQVASEVVCCRREVDAINAFARAQGDGQPPEVFFRGQMLELMRWAARHCRKTDGDGRSFDDPSVRSAFVKAALIASEIWSRRVYRDAFEIGERDDAEARRRAMGAIRKGIEESNPAPHLGFLMGRGRQLFTHYLPRELPAFPDLFKEETGLAIDEYFVAAAGLAQYAFSRRGVGPLFNFASVADQTTSQATIRKFIDLESQRADDLEQCLWRDFSAAGYRGLRERPIFVSASGKAAILDPTFYYEKMSISPLFHAAHNLADKERDGDKRVFGAFGDAFELYAVKSLPSATPVSRPIATPSRRKESWVTEAQHRDENAPPLSRRREGVA